MLAMDFFLSKWMLEPSSWVLCSSHSYLDFLPIFVLCLVDVRPYFGVGDGGSDHVVVQIATADRAPHNVVGKELKEEQNSAWSYEPPTAFDLFLFDLTLIARSWKKNKIGH